MSEIVQAFYKEYTTALRFLETRGFTKNAADHGLLQELVYARNNFVVRITLEVREGYTSYACGIVRQDGSLAWGAVDALLSHDELARDNLPTLFAEARRAWSNRKWLRKVVAERDAAAARRIFQKDARWLAAVLQRYGEVLEARARERLGVG